MLNHSALNDSDLKNCAGRGGSTDGPPKLKARRELRHIAPGLRNLTLHWGLPIIELALRVCKCHRRRHYSAVVASEIFRSFFSFVTDESIRPRLKPLSQHEHME